jgi:hypothetical protein
MDRAGCRLLAKSESDQYALLMRDNTYAQYYNDCMVSKGWTLVEDTRAASN